MNRQPFITVLMPCLNVEPYIKECVESVVSQTIFDDLEVFIIDAGSNDGTYEIVKDYEDKYNNIHLINSEKKSYGYQLNLGLKSAKGKYIAILETDDFIRNDMYEILYNIAEINSLEYIKANFLSFITLKNGDKLYSSSKLWPENDDRYKKIIDPTYVDDLYVSDFNIWKGIFKREFLLKNSIYANETPGAAFQDIGIMELVLANADRAMYVKEELYRYRTDRESASMKSGRGLIFSKNEFERLLEEKRQNIKNLKGLYLHMFSSFVGNMNLLQSKESFLDDEEIKESFIWLKNQLNIAFSNGIISKQDVDPDLYDKYERGIDNPIAYISNNVKQEESKKEFLEEIRKRKAEVYIFGAGIYGRNCFAFLDKNGIGVNAFYDNFPEKVQDLPDRIILLDGKNAKKKNSSDVIVIANLKHKEEIKLQLLEQGLSEKDILLWSEK